MTAKSVGQLAALYALLGTSVFVVGQTTPLAGGPAPATQPVATGAATPGRGARGARGGPAGPAASPDDIAEMAKLNSLPAYAAALGDGDYSVGPNYKTAAEDAVRPGVPKGKVISFSMNSADSKIFPGTGAPFKRAVAVYVPAQYVPGTPAPFIVSCDQYGLSPRTGHFSVTLDNMIADHRLPVLCAVMVASGGPERSMEYDTVSSKYCDFVETEVLPAAEKAAGITLTKDPDGRMTYGGSSGGIAAFTMAWFHPELYHRVATFSATLVNLQHSDAYPHGGWEYPEHLVADAPAKPLRIWMETAQNDNGSTTASAGFRNWIIANERTAAALKAKGYHYQFVYAKNAGHTDSKVMSEFVPEALEFVWKGYPIAGAKPATAPTAH
jgi:enterochelin esterase-like enzyme